MARQSGMKDDQYVAAYAMYEMGVMLSQTTDYAKGRAYLTKAKVSGLRVIYTKTEYS